MEAWWNRNDIGLWYRTDFENRYYDIIDNGWKEINGECYIFDNRGYALQDVWYYDGGYNAWYYLDDECKMVRGSKDKILWLCVLCFVDDGKMHRDCLTPDGWKVDGNGNWINYVN
ncbi:hypothetical protein [Clostridium sp. YIM B02555]|uniref:hypothetical protein n=1 Tax=Clostridium sp. YIM B02555 TaxID=2911968 RepID=UPI0031B5F843